MGHGQRVPLIHPFWGTPIYGNPHMGYVPTRVVWLVGSDWHSLAPGSKRFLEDRQGTVMGEAVSFICRNGRGILLIAIIMRTVTTQTTITRRSCRIAEPMMRRPRTPLPPGAVAAAPDEGVDVDVCHNMYIYIYINIYICIDIYIYIYIHTYIYILYSIHIYIYISIYTHTYIYTHDVLDTYSNFLFVAKVIHRVDLSGNQTIVSNETNKQWCSLFSLLVYSIALWRLCETLQPLPLDWWRFGGAFSFLLGYNTYFPECVRNGALDRGFLSPEREKNTLKKRHHMVNIHDFLGQQKSFSRETRWISGV